MDTDREALGRRVFLAHLELERRIGNRLGYDDVGRMVAEREGRDTPYSKGNVYRWEKGLKMPSREALGALAELAGFSKGWLAYGEGEQFTREAADLAAAPASERARVVPEVPAAAYTPVGRGAKAKRGEAGRGGRASPGKRSSRPAPKHPRGR